MENYEKQEEIKTKIKKKCKIKSISRNKIRKLQKQKKNYGKTRTSKKQ